MTTTTKIVELNAVCKSIKIAPRKARKFLRALGEVPSTGHKYAWSVGEAKRIATELKSLAA